MTTLSPLQQFKTLCPNTQHAFIDSLTDEEAHALTNSWWFTARPQQLPPEGDWFCWLILAGRGFGKTRTASEWIIQQVIDGKARRIALIGRTAADVRDIQIDGVSGILAVAEKRGIKAHYEPSKRRITFGNGAIATAYSAEEPKLLRGPEHDCGWLDEAASFAPPRNLDDNDAYANFVMGLRLGDNPRFVVTTTPRPTKLIKHLIADPSTQVTRGSTYDNAANLAKSFLAEVRRRYEGTRIGQQELHGEVLDDVEGALWSYELIHKGRVETFPVLQRVVVAIDPAVSTNATSDFTGACVAGLGYDDEVYVLHAEAIKASPNAWAMRVLQLYDEYNAGRIIAEKNNGGDLVEHTIRTVRKNASIKTIHASQGKKLRAEPVVSMYEQARVRHVGTLTDLEAQMTVFPVITDEHDDLVDALVYAITELAGLHAKAPSQLTTFSGYGRRHR